MARNILTDVKEKIERKQMETQIPTPTKAHTIAFRVTPQQYSNLLNFSKEEGYKNLSQWMQQLVKDEIADRTGSGL